MLEAIDTAINAVGAIAPSSLSDAELDDVVVALRRTQSALAAVTAALTGEWDRRRVWAADGSRSAVAHLAHRANVPRAVVACDVTRALRLQTMPLTDVAFAAGEITADRVDVLGRANAIELRRQFLRDEHILVAAARDCDCDDFERVVRKWKDQAEDEVGRDAVERRWRDRRFSIVTTFDGSIDLCGRGPALEGSIIQGEVERLEHQLFEDDLAKARAEHGDDVPLDRLPRDAQQRRFDALALMATRSRSLPDDVPLARPLVTVVIDHPRFKDLCLIEQNLVDVNPREVLRFADDFDIEHVVFGPAGQVIDVGRRTRVFRGALRRAIQVRDLHCRLHRACRVPAARCEVDHIIEFEDGGETTQDNGMLACGPHNRWKHAEKRRRQARPPPAA